MTKIRKKLIEVALPLEAINIASAREKSIRHGHPSTLHLWWARRPLAAARAVIFAQLVDDPSSWPDLFPTEKKQYGRAGGELVPRTLITPERKNSLTATCSQPFTIPLLGEAHFLWRHSAWGWKVTRAT